jgi:hypothetical protein
MFWLLGVGVLLSVLFGNSTLQLGGDAWPFVWLACVFLVGMLFSFSDRK